MEGKDIIYLHVHLHGDKELGNAGQAAEALWNIFFIFKSLDVILN